MNRRPRIELVAPAASLEEAAAIVAALEQFMRDSAPRAQQAAPNRSNWARAGLLEATGHDAAEAPHPWGPASPR